MVLIEHLEKLRHFLKLSSYKSINEAAQAMAMSQAGLSKSISTLEFVLGTQLFHRSQQGIILTKEGEILLRSARTIMKEANQAEAQLRSPQAISVPQSMRIGMYDSIAIYFFSELFNYLNSAYPSLKIELTVDKSESLYEQVKSEKLDFAIGVFRQKGDKGTVERMLIEDRYAFFAAPSISIKRDTPLIIHPGATDEFGVSTEKILSRLIRSRPIYKIFNFETLKSLTVAGVGVGVLPTQVARQFVQRGLLQSARMASTPSLFGKHAIGYLTSSKFHITHSEFSSDIFRLVERWTNA